MILFFSGEKGQFPISKWPGTPMMIRTVNRPDHIWKIHFLLISENEFFHEINVTELHDVITSLHGIHV